MPSQKVYVDQTALSQIQGQPGEEISLPLLYTTSDGNQQLAGLNIQVHFDSNILSFEGFDPAGDSDSAGFLINEKLFYTDDQSVSDSSDADSDTSTDQKFSLIWADMDSAWPGTAFPATLGTVKFKILDSVDTNSIGTKINFTSSQGPNGYSFEETAIMIEGSNANTPTTISGNINGAGSGSGSIGSANQTNDGYDYDGWGDLAGSGLGQYRRAASGSGSSSISGSGIEYDGFDGSGDGLF